MHSGCKSRRGKPAAAHSGVPGAALEGSLTLCETKGSVSDSWPCGHLLWSWMLTGAGPAAVTWPSISPQVWCLQTRRGSQHCASPCPLAQGTLRTSYRTGKYSGQTTSELQSKHFLIRNNCESEKHCFLSTATKLDGSRAQQDPPRPALLPL